MDMQAIGNSNSSAVLLPGPLAGALSLGFGSKHYQPRDADEGQRTRQFSTTPPERHRSRRRCGHVMGFGQMSRIPYSLTRTGRRSRRPSTSDESGRRVRHCRSPRSTGRSRGQRSFRHDEARQQSHRRLDRPRSIRSEPMIARGCTSVRGRCRPACAYTSRTMRWADPHRHDDHRHGGDTIEPLRPIRPNKALPLQP